jgi:hypothetical protein
LKGKVKVGSGAKDERKRKVYNRREKEMVAMQRVEQTKVKGK